MIPYVLCHTILSLTPLRALTYTLLALTDASGLPPASSTADPAYTVPAIHHVPTNSYIMDSYAIAKFLETTYPSTKYRALPLHSEVGDEIVSKAAAALDPVFGPCLTPTEITMLSPRAQVYFRTTREKMFGCKIEELISGDKAEQIWAGAATEIQRVNAIVEKQKESSRGPFLFGKEPTFSDFVIAGALQSARAIDQGVFERTMGYPGFKGIYEACEPYMAKKD